MEAEDMTLDTYQVETLSFTSNGALINLKGPGVVGSATASFPGDSGAYDITVVYHDENDGVAQLSVSIAGNTVDNWSLDEVISGGQQPEEFNRFTREIATGYTINNGDEIRIDGLQGNWDHANVDYIEFSGSAPPPPAQENVAYVAKSGGNYDDPVEALNDSGSWCESPTRETPCTMFIGPGRYEIQQPLITKDLINIIGAGESATIVTRGHLGSCVPDQDPTISHAAGYTQVTDLSIISECSEGGLNIELEGGQLALQRVIINYLGHTNSLLRSIAIRSRGGLFLSSATVDGNIVSEDGFFRITNSTVVGHTEYHPTVEISESARATISNSQFSGTHVASVFFNEGELEINYTIIRPGIVGGGVENHGTLLMNGTTITGAQSGIIQNFGEAIVHHSIFDSFYPADPTEPGYLDNNGGEMLVSHTVLRNIEVSDGAGTLRCLFVSDGAGNELGQGCMTPP
jgi:hypothetical protein